MKAIKIIGHVDEQHRLTADVPAELPSGPIKAELVIESEEDEAGADWAAGVVREWAAELSDPRQDI